MTTRIETNGIEDVVTLLADEGKVLRRKGTDENLGKEVALGISYFFNGVKLETPHVDTPEDFEEIDDELEGVEETLDY